MCLLLCGGVNLEADAEELEKATTGSYYFQATKKGAIRKDIAANGYDFRLTSSHCDCSTNLGRGDLEDPEVIELADTIERLSRVGGVRSIYLVMYVTGRPLKGSIKVKLDEIDVGEFVATIQDLKFYEIIVSSCKQKN